MKGGEQVDKVYTSKHESRVYFDDHTVARLTIEYANENRPFEAVFCPVGDILTVIRQRSILKFKTKGGEKVNGN